MSLDITSQVELYDSDILKIEQGPLAWANARVGSRRNLDDFVNGLKDRFFKIGFFTYIELGYPMECRCYPHHDNLPDCPDLKPIEDAAYTIKVSITSRVAMQVFDYEQMQHEVRNNILNMPGQDKGTIKFDAKAFLRNSTRKHRHN